MKIDKRFFGILLVSLFVIGGAVLVSSTDQNVVDRSSTQEKNEIQVEQVESYDTGGNMGYGEMIEVHLENGTQLNYQKYTNNDPRCYGMPEGQVNETRCEDYGETSKDEGFDEARRLIDNIGDERETEKICFYPSSEEIFRKCD